MVAPPYCAAWPNVLFRSTRTYCGCRSGWPSHVNPNGKPRVFRSSRVDLATVCYLCRRHVEDLVQLLLLLDPRRLPTLPDCRRVLPLGQAHRNLKGRNSEGRGRRGGRRGQRGGVGRIDPEQTEQYSCFLETSATRLKRKQLSAVHSWRL